MAESTVVPQADAQASPLCRLLGCCAGILWLAGLFGPFSDRGTSSFMALYAVALATAMAFSEMLRHGPWGALAFVTAPVAALLVARGRRPGFLLWLTVFLVVTSPGCWLVLDAVRRIGAASIWGVASWLAAVALLLVTGCLDPYLRHRQERERQTPARRP